MDISKDLFNIINQSGAHPALGWKHCQRVYHLAKELSPHLALDDEVLFIAAMLHDAGKYPVYALANVDHTLRSKGIAMNLLKSYSLEQTRIAMILDAIECHMYYSEPGGSDEAVYLRDSNILDSLGNIGLMKFFSLVGQDELITSPEEALSRAQTFAEALPKKVSTKSGRRLAVKRREEMLRFLSGLKRQSAEYAWI
ncbi:HD domain-containing protein [Dehalobacter sp. DCM]|uniref:HD domain-containing protein n=1 Tax=Dehalobacter sp. DCM TaxID=2907827 RepID=UPI003081DAD3|nr:HD domain-containing protein [Dehalobacter sp. DCM]